LEIVNNSTDSPLFCLPEVPMFINRYGLRPRASSASGIENRQGRLPI